MTPQQINTALQRHPLLITHNLNSKMMPLIQYLYTLGIKPKQIGTIVTRAPRLFCSRLTVLQRRVKLIQARLQLSDKQLKRVLIACPQILPNRIDFKVETLLMLLCAGEPYGLSITVAAASKLIATAPTLLTCSVDNNLQPKIAVLLHYANGDRGAVGRVVIGAPSLLLYSLKARLEPRLFELQQLGLPFVSIRACANLPETAYREWLQRQLLRSNSSSSDSSSSGTSADSSDGNSSG
eukprot:3327-Heterococcus_DN1.PRE.5